MGEHLSPERQTEVSGETSEGKRKIQVRGETDYSKLSTARLMERRLHIRNQTDNAGRQQKELNQIDRELNQPHRAEELNQALQASGAREKALKKLQQERPPRHEADIDDTTSPKPKGKRYETVARDRMLIKRYHRMDPDALTRQIEELQNKIDAIQTPGEGTGRKYSRKSELRDLKEQLHAARFVHDNRSNRDALDKASTEIPAMVGDPQYDPLYAGLSQKQLARERRAAQDRVEATQKQLGTEEGAQDTLPQESLALAERHLAAIERAIRTQEEETSEPNEVPSKEPEAAPEQEVIKSGDTEDRDELFDKATSLVRERQQASVSFLQRQFKISHSRAERIIDQLEKAGVVGSYDGHGPREVLPAQQEVAEPGAETSPDIIETNGLDFEAMTPDELTYYISSTRELIAEWQQNLRIAEEHQDEEGIRFWNKELAKDSSALETAVQSAERRGITTAVQSGQTPEAAPAPSEDESRLYDHEFATLAPASLRERINELRRTLEFNYQYFQRSQENGGEDEGKLWREGFTPAQARLKAALRVAARKDIDIEASAADALTLPEVRRPDPTEEMDPLFNELMGSDNNEVLRRMTELREQLTQLHTEQQNAASDESLAEYDRLIEETEASLSTVLDVAWVKGIEIPEDSYSFGAKRPGRQPSAPERERGENTETTPEEDTKTRLNRLIEQLTVKLPKGIKKNSAEMQVIQLWQGGVTTENEEEIQEMEKNTWLALTNIALRHCEVLLDKKKIEPADREFGQALADAYAGLRSLRVVHNNDNETRHILTVIARSHSSETALEMYQDLMRAFDAGGAVVKRDDGTEISRSTDFSVDWEEDLSMATEQSMKKLKRGERKKVEAALPVVDSDDPNERLHQTVARLDALERYRSGMPLENQAESAAVETPETPETSEQRLERHRKEFAYALQKHGKIFRRSSVEEVAQAFEAYTFSAQEEMEDRLEALHVEFPDGVNESNTANFNERLVDTFLNHQLEEEKRVRENMKESAEQATWYRFRAAMKRHAKARMIISGGLTLGAVGAAASGNFLAAGAIQGLKGVIGLGSAVTADAALLKLQEKQGLTEKLTQEQISSLGVQGLESRLHAHTLQFLEFGYGQFGKRKKSINPFDRSQDYTGQHLLDELSSRRKENFISHVGQLTEAGRNADDIVASLLNQSQEQEVAHYKDLLKDISNKRRAAIQRAVISTTVGVLSGAMTETAAFEKISSVLSATDAVKDVGDTADLLSSADSLRSAAPATDTLSSTPDSAMQETIADSAITPPESVTENLSASPTTPQVELNETAAPDSVTTEAPSTAAPEQPQITLDEATTSDNITEPVPQAPAQASEPIELPDSAETETAATSEEPLTETQDGAQVTLEDKTTGTEPAAPATQTTLPDGKVELTESPAADTATQTSTEPTPETVETMGSPKNIETVQQGDSVWKLAERQLTNRFGDAFTGLDEARQTYVIDAIKDRLVADPEAFGLEDLNLQPGDQIDFSSVFEGENTVNLDDVFSEAKALDQAAVDSILENNTKIEEWVDDNPGEALTEEQVDEILSSSPGTQELATAENPVAAADAAKQSFVEKMTQEVAANNHPESELAQAAASSGDNVEVSSYMADQLEHYFAVNDIINSQLSPDTAKQIHDSFGELPLATAVKETKLLEAMPNLSDTATGFVRNLSKHLRNLYEATPTSLRGNVTVKEFLERFKAEPAWENM
ncbi:MAG: DNA translocase FtsK [bacterium]|nr:DNA translocase FtsK [bacterium]